MNSAIMYSWLSMDSQLILVPQANEANDFTNSCRIASSVCIKRRLIASYSTVWNPKTRPLLELRFGMLYKCLDFVYTSN